MDRKIIRRAGMAAVFLALCALAGCAGKDSGKWEEAYKSQISSWESEKGSDFLGYEYIYLDEDDIPELVLYCNDDAWTGADIYTFADGQVLHLDIFDMDGNKANTEGSMLTSTGRQGMSDSYMEKKGIVFQTGGMMGSYVVNCYKLEDGKLNRIAEYDYTDVSGWSEEDVPISYEIRYKKKDGSVISEKKDEDVEFADCDELKDIESEYSFSYKDAVELNPKQ